MERLRQIQQQLKAPKNQYNQHGGYKFRSAEDIFEAVKPLLDKFKLTLILTDDIVPIEGGFQYETDDRRLVTTNRVYIKAIAQLYDDTGKLIAQSVAFAREEEVKKGMAFSQLTGATSSYARKYALNGLFAIDDNQDADKTNNHEDDTPRKQSLFKCEVCGKIITKGAYENFAHKCSDCYKKSKGESK